MPPDVQLTQIPPDKPKILEPAHVQPVNHFRQVNNTAPVITNNEIESTMPTIEQLDNSIISNITIDGDAPLGNIVNSPAAGSETNRLLQRQRLMIIRH